MFNIKTGFSFNCLILASANILAFTFLNSCGGGSGGGAAPGTITGIFWDSPVNGLKYKANPSGQTDTTRMGGKFVCKEGDTIGFYVGDVALGQTLCKEIVTPIDLVPGATDVTNPIVINIARFLQSLDNDQDPSNGINISIETTEEVTGRPIDINNPELDFDNNVDLEALFIMLDRTPVTANKAQFHLRTALISSKWRVWEW
ncbi:MAG: hypothetical protein AMJ60_04000 [Desulfobacterales bacterium SG8_35]|nr:MAG: hypothetical protein AMJ60_04000 [Desulfobacterales bacterium SG8_35]